MKKYLKIIIPVLALGLLAFLGFKVASKIQHKEQVAENIQTLPAFSYQNLKDKAFTNQDLKSKPTIFIYFNSECHYCQNEAQEIKKHQEKLKDVQLVFVSKEEPDAIKEFAKEYKLTGYDNIHFLFDEGGGFAKTFGATSIPYLLIYNKDQKLVKKIKGQTKISVILEALKKDGTHEAK